ncbi:MAG: TlpA family protein disulfide reductase [Melioribacteraceae bacterium]|nr:TlpA family protein disulfide reductase [Melioribacteraceae bacterium]MCF8353232.1 TlpA family protein disulfide reductase [Melioribacteraceae bacterium]MCF8393964.1 TlpA family protein disulfide reductase [Melioribacteraceae bacterium]MCF8418734.1 TlpA family protein disulfide reductase [Melioribacteraceae bacterium]
MLQRIVLIILLVSAVSFAQNENDLKRIQNFSAEHLDDNVVELNDYIGDGPLLLNFWATWCKPCIEEMKQFQKLYEKYSDQGMKMVAVSVDSERSVSKVKPFIKSRGYTFDVVYDTNGDIARQFYAQSIPYTMIVNKKGEIVYTHSGYMKGDEIKTGEIIEKLIKAE